MRKLIVVTVLIVAALFGVARADPGSGQGTGGSPAPCAANPCT